MKKILLVLLLLPGLYSSGQDLSYTRNLLNTLTSKSLWGRGYTKDGMHKAGQYIEHQFSKMGLVPLGGGNFRQPFSYPVNTFPGKMKVVLNNKKLTPGEDFIVGTQSTGAQIHARLIAIDSATYRDESGKVEVLIRDKLTWSVGRQTNGITQILINKKTFHEIPADIRLSIENVFVPEFAAANVCAMVKGTKYPDRIILITAHYDHLGGMGSKTYFPGANDNASGVSFMLSLAKYYAEHPQPFSIGFIAFAGEEAGLLGSHYFVENPKIPLQNIRFLINLDLVGTGEAGMTVVNAPLYPDEFNKLMEINNQKQLFPSINKRGKAANSDHYWFSEKGVPAFFMYTQGGPTAYHDVFDRPESLPFTKFYQLFTLITNFNADLMNGSPN